MELNAGKRKWTSAAAWLQRFSKSFDPTMSAATKRHLTRVGWSAGITVGQERATALTLPQLLADDRLNSTILDLTAECTQVEVNYDGPASVYVCGTIFADKVSQLGQGSGDLPGWFWRRFIEPVENKRRKILYFSVYWPKHKHWVSVKVDFSMGCVSVGWC